MIMNKLRYEQFFIDGHWVDPIERNTLPVINPATEQVIASVAMGSGKDIDLAVAAAKGAFPSFSATSKTARKDLLQRILNVYRRRYDEMSELICAELGAPIKLCHNAQTAVGVGHLEATIEALDAFEFEQKNRAGDLILREPIGVCGLICPWNWPINQIALKVFPALAVGCTVVLKPSEITPLNALLFAEILAEAGVPKGVFNLVNGDGPTVGAALSKHPNVHMVSFTGSTRAGTQITKDAADTVKRVTLELGGKSPNIVLDDADLAAAVKANLNHCFQNSGQSCNAPTRLLIPANQYDKAVALAQDLAERYRVGSPDQEGNHIGPVVSLAQYNKIQALIKTGIDDGARLVFGGLGKPNGFECGYYVKPTVFADVDNAMAIAQEEIFGPVLVMIPYRDIDHAIAIANDTPYGLAAYIQSGNVDKATQVMRRLRAGMVRINGSDIGYASPFGGYKLSGNGREGGEFGLEDYCEIKAVSYPES